MCIEEKDGEWNNFTNPFKPMEDTSQGFEESTLDVSLEATLPSKVSYHPRAPSSIAKSGSAGRAGGDPVSPLESP